MPRTCQKLLVLWMGGWLEKMKIMQTQLQLKLKLKLKLSLAKYPSIDRPFTSDWTRSVAFG